MLITIDEKDSRPLYRQIISQVREQVRNGLLKPGEELPSVRELADSLGVNMHTVRNAYLKLREQGIINLRLGRKARIANFQTLLDYSEIEAGLKDRLKDIVNEALTMGLSQEDILDMVRFQFRQAQNSK